MSSDDSSSPIKNHNASNGDLFNFSESSLSKDDTNKNENDFDLFDEIIIDKEKEKTDHIVEESNKKLKDAEINLKKFQEENENLKKDNITLLKNISSLWRTATTQLRQKSVCIAKLTRDNESLKFRSGIQRLSKDDFDRAVSRIAAYDKEEFRDFMKEFQDHHSRYKGERSEHTKARPLRPKMNIRASVRGSRIHANTSVDSIRLQKLLGQKSGSITRHVIKDFERRRPMLSNFARNGNKQNNKHKSSKKIISGHHSIYAKLNNTEKSIGLCELKSKDCSTKKRIFRSKENDKIEICDEENHEDEHISLNKNQSKCEEGTTSDKIVMINSIKDNYDVIAVKVNSLSKQEACRDDEFGEKIRLAQENIVVETKMAEVDNGSKLEASCMEHAITCEFEKSNRHLSDPVCNIPYVDVRDERSEMVPYVSNKSEVKPAKTIVDKAVIGSIIENPESFKMLDFDCLSKIADSVNRSFLNEVKPVGVVDKSKDLDNNSLTIQNDMSGNTICSKTRSIKDAKLDSNKEPSVNRFKDFVPEKVVNTVSSSGLRAYRIPKKASKENEIDVVCNNNYVSNKSEVKPAKTIVDKAVIGSIIENPESFKMLDFDCLSKIADSVNRSFLNEVKPVGVVDKSKNLDNNSLTIQNDMSENTICSKTRSIKDAKLDSNKEPSVNRFKDFVPEKVVNTVSSSDLRAYRIPKKASKENEIDVVCNMPSGPVTSKPENLYDKGIKGNSANQHSAGKSHLKSNDVTENLLVKCNVKDSCNQHDRQSPSQNYKERSKSKENERTQTLKPGNESTSRHHRGIQNKENDKYSKQNSLSKRDQNQDKKIISQTTSGRRSIHQNTVISECHSFSQRKRPLSISPDRSEALLETTKYNSSKKRSHFSRKSLISNENDCYRSKNKFYQSSVISKDKTKFWSQFRERSRAASDRVLRQNRLKVNRSSLRRHSSKSCFLPDKCHPDRKNLRSSRDLHREAHVRKEERSNSHKSRSSSQEKNYNHAEREKRSHSHNYEADDSQRFKSVDKKSELQNLKSSQCHCKDINIRSKSIEEKSHPHKIRPFSQDKIPTQLEGERRSKSQNRERKDLQKFNNVEKTVCSQECEFPHGSSERSSSRGSNVDRKLDYQDKGKQTNDYVMDKPDNRNFERSQRSNKLRENWDVKELVKKLRDRRLQSSRYLSVSRQPSKNIYKLRRMKQEDRENSFFRNCDKIKRSVRKFNSSHTNSRVSCNEIDRHKKINTKINDSFLCDDLLKPSHESSSFTAQIQPHSKVKNKLRGTSLRRKPKVSSKEKEPGEISSSEDDTDINTEGNVAHVNIIDSNLSVNKQHLSAEEISHVRHIQTSPEIIEASSVSSLSYWKKIECPQNDSLNRPKSKPDKGIMEGHKNQDCLLEKKKQDCFSLCLNEELNEAKCDSHKVIDVLSMPVRLGYLFKSSSLSSPEGKQLKDLSTIPLKKTDANSSLSPMKKINEKKCGAQYNSIFSPSVDDPTVHSIPAMLVKSQRGDKFKKAELTHIRNTSKDFVKDDTKIDCNYETEQNYSATSSYKDKFSFQEEDTIDHILKQNVADSNQLHSDDSETSLLQFLGNNETPEKTQESLLSFTPPPFVKPPTPPFPLSTVAQDVQSCPAHKLEYLKNILGLTQVCKNELGLNHKSVSSITDEPQYISTVVPSVDFSKNNCFKLNSPLNHTKVLTLVNTPSPKTLTTSSCSPIEIATPLNKCIDSASSCTPPSANTSIKSSTPIVAFDLNRKSKFPRETLPILVQKVVDERNKSKSSYPCEKTVGCSDQQIIGLPCQMSNNNSSSGKDNLDVNFSSRLKDCRRSNPSFEHSIPVIAVKELDKSFINSDNPVSSVDASENLLTEKSNSSTGLTLSNGSLKKKVPFTTISHIIDKSNSTFYDFGLQNKEESRYVSSFSRKVDDIEDSLLGNSELSLTKQNNSNLSKEKCLDSDSDSSSGSTCSTDCNCGGCSSSSSSSCCSTCSSKTNSVSHASLMGQAQSFADCLKVSISPKKYSHSPSKRALKNSSENDSNSLNRSKSCFNYDELPCQQNVELVVEKNGKANIDSNCFTTENARIDDQETCKFGLENTKVVETTMQQIGNTSFLNVLKEGGTSKANDKSCYSGEKENNIKEANSLSDGLSQSQNHFDHSFSNSRSPAKIIMVRRKNICLTPSASPRSYASPTSTTKMNYGFSKSSVSVISVVHDENDHILRDVTSQSSNDGNTDKKKIVVDSSSDCRSLDKCMIDSSNVNINNSTSQPEKSSLQNAEPSHKKTLSSEPFQQVVLVKKSSKRRKVVLSKN